MDTSLASRQRHMRQRLLEAEAGHGSSSSSSCMCPTIPCCTCGQGNPSAFRVGCRGPGCRHSVCTACAYKDDSGNLDLFYCVHCFGPERQRRIGWTNIEAPLVEALQEAPHRPTSSSDRASCLGETSLSRRLPDSAELEPASHVGNLPSLTFMSLKTEAGAEPEAPI